MKNEPTPADLSCNLESALRYLDAGADFTDFAIRDIAKTACRRAIAAERDRDFANVRANGEAMILRHAESELAEAVRLLRLNTRRWNAESFEAPETDAFLDKHADKTSAPLP
jgi:hypothetical protein